MDNLFAHPERVTEPETKKKGKKRANRSFLSDIDAGIILRDARALREKVQVLDESGIKAFLILHTDRIVNKLDKRMKERGGESKIQKASLDETEP